MGCGSSRPLTPPPPDPPKRNKGKGKSKSKGKGKGKGRHSGSSRSSGSSSGSRSGSRSRSRSRSSRSRSRSRSRDSGLYGTTSASDAGEGSRMRQSPRTAAKMADCTFSPTTNKRSTQLMRTRPSRRSMPVFDRLATRKVRAKRITYRPSKDEAYLTYVAAGAPGENLRSIAREKRKMLRARNAELVATTSRLKEHATGTGPSSASASYRSVIDKVNHLNRAIALLTAAMEQAEHKLYYAFEEWYAKNCADLPDPPSPRSQRAATKIQAAYRGYAVRARPPTPYARGGNSRFRRHNGRGRGRIGSYARAEERAAVQIQAAFRGYQVRRDLDAGYFYDDDDGYHGDRYFDRDDEDDEDDNLVNAAFTGSRAGLADDLYAGYDPYEDYDPYDELDPYDADRRDRSRDSPVRLPPRGESYLRS